MFTFCVVFLVECTEILPVLHDNLWVLGSLARFGYMMRCIQAGSVRRKRLLPLGTMCSTEQTFSIVVGVELNIQGVLIGKRITTLVRC
jgi:hypothetical protein